MVGVAGKYKGCETCRWRRVKCNNERPSCSNCAKIGQQCGGYEKQRVFITGTPDDKGRVASHPKKATAPGTPSSSRSKSRVKLEATSTPEATPERDVGRSGRSRQRRHRQPIIPRKPLTSAWDDYIALESDGGERYALVTALQQPMQYVDAREPEWEGADSFRVGMAPYTPIDASPSSGSSVQTSARCLVHLSSPSDGQTPTEDYCVWLYENKQGSSTGYGSDQPYDVDTVQIMGADFFSDFPHHHLFVRAFRPIMIGMAVMNRQQTFLADAEWISTPWKSHPKSLFDQLLDLVAFLPYLLEKTDEIALQHSTTARRDGAKNLLQNGLMLETRFDHWLHNANQGTRAQPVPFWAEEMPEPGGLPFHHAYAFKDSVTGAMFLYYWMSQIPLHRCIETLYGIIYEPVLDVFEDMWSTLSSDLRIEDLPKYQQTHEFAANVCRGLDSALEGTVQPDILIAPMTMALELYRELSNASQDCTLEILWLEAFRERLVEKGAYVVSVVQEQTWLEVGRL